MPDFIVTSPTGQKFKVTAPDGATQEQALAYAQQQFTAQPPAEGYTAAQIAAMPEAQARGFNPKLYGPDWRGFPPTGYAGPDKNARSDTQAIHETLQQMRADELEQDAKIPFDIRNSTQERLKPVLGGLLGSLVTLPAGGWGGLALSSGAAGLGTMGGDLARQRDMREPIDVMSAAKEGGKAAAISFGVGAVLKGLGAAAKAIFSSPLDEEAGAAARFAQEQGAPFPLSSAAPGSGAARTQQASRMLLPGEIRTQVDANRVSQFLNSRVGTIVDNATPVDEAAIKGQQYLRQAFEPGETVYTQTFQKLRGALGDDTAIPLTETRDAIESAADALKQRGEMKSVYNRLRNIMKGGAQEQTVAQMDELYSGILKDTARNANARREANVVLSAIGKDIDSVAKDFGVSFSDDIAAAKAVRDQFRELRNIPQLERLSQPFGEKGGTLGSRQWMTEMFSNPNGKALAELRNRNPDLYHELADSYLANNLNRFSKPVKDGIGRALDGPAFRSWYEQNASSIRMIYGAPQAQALDNFSLYAKYMSGAVQRAANPARISSDPAALFTRGAAEVVATKLNPAIMVPGEAASYVLAKGLSDPNSTLFRLFTEGFSPATRSFVVKSGQIAGQTAANEQGQR